MPLKPKNILIAVLLGAAPLSAAWACDSAEKLRLSDEIRGLAQKNAWAGVERKYGEILKTKCEIKLQISLIAADSAQNLGKTFQRWERLAAANAVEPTDEVTEAMAGIEQAYGRISIKGDPRRRAPLLRDSMPFAPDQRKSIEWGQKVVEGTGSFKGMLPAGEYKVADVTFLVVPGGADFQVQQIGKARKNSNKGGGKAPQGGGDQPLINWVGPIAMLGTGFFGTAAPGKATLREDAPVEAWITGPKTVSNGVECPVYDPENPSFDPSVKPIAGDPNRKRETPEGEPACLPTERQPASIAALRTAVIDITLGGEVGFTYRKPEMGAFATAGYRRTVGRNGLNQVTLAGGLVVRPGDFRITAGPTWSVVFGSGSGFVDWVDEGQSVEFRADRQSSAPFAGFGMGGGAAGSVGWALLDLGGLQGIVDAHGHWMFDGSRHYTGAGLRLGIVPKVKRFEE